MSSYPMQDPSQQPPQAGNTPLQSAPTAQNPSQLLGRLQQIVQTPPQPVPQAGADQGSPVKRFLTNFFWGMGQGALQSVGLPTDYQKQQQVIQNNQRQQELSQHAQEIGSMVQLHQAQTADAQRKAQEDAASKQMVPVGKFGQWFGLAPDTLLPQGMLTEAISKHLTTPPHERTPLSTSQGYYNLDPQGHATPIVGLDNKPLMPAKQDKPDTPEQQYLDEYQRTHPGSTVAQAIGAYTSTTQRSPQPTPPMMFIPNGDGTSTAVAVRPGMKVGIGAETSNQFGQEPGKIQKLVQPFDDLVSAADQAHQYAAQNTAPGDAALLLKYVDAVKPTKGFRLTNTELNMFAHTRGVLGDMQALGQRLNNGQMLTPDQKQNMLAIVDLSANHAKQMKASLMQKYSQYANPGGGDASAPAAPPQPAVSGADPFAAFGGKKR